MRSIQLSVISAVLLLLYSPRLDAAPTVSNLSLRGLQIGATTVLTIDGEDLLPEPQLLGSLPLAKVTLLPNGAPNRIQLEVTLAAEVMPGIYAFRLANAKGISVPFLLGVDRLPQQAFAPQISVVPIAMHGSIAGEQRLQMTLIGKRGQRLVADVEAQRLGSGLRPVIRLFDQRGVQIAWSGPQAAINMDARVDTLLPSDGNYTLELHDVLYRAPNPAPFRLKVGDLHYADLAFPLALSRGAKGSVRLLSSVPGDPKVELEFDGGLLPGELPVNWACVREFTGAQPRIAVSEFAEYVEQPAGGGLQEIPAIPAGINGILGAANEEDRYLLKVTPGAKLQFDVTARRRGSALDGVLSLLDEQGNGLASNDDRPGTPDPGLDFTVPEGANKIVVALRDLHRRGGAGFVYRIVVRDLGQPDFSVNVPTVAINVPPGGAQVIPVEVQRTGYGGPIEISIDGLPAGMQLTGNTIPAGATSGLVTVSAPNSAPAGAPGSPPAAAPVAARVAIVGKSVDPPRVRLARLPDTGISRGLPWLRSEIGLALTEPGPFALQWISEETNMPLGGKLPIKVAIQRAGGVAGNIRFRLLTTQPPIKKTVKQNNIDVQVDDVDRMLRLEGTPQFGPEVKEADLNLLVPVDLPMQPWSVVLVGELLAGETVVSSSTTIVRSCTPKGELPRLVFEDEEAFVAMLTQGGGQASLEAADKQSGKASLKVTPDQRFNPMLANLGVKIREKPAAGEFRYLQFAWKKKGGDSVCLQLNHDGAWGPGGSGRPDAKFRYHSGPGPECYGASLLVDAKLPEQFVVVTRDLFADFGEFTLTGLAFSPMNGEFALYDHLYLARTPGDFELVMPK